MGSEFQRPITGSITAAAQTIDLSSPNSASEIVQITGTWVGTLVVEGSNDGVTYYTIDCIDRSTKLIITSMSANGSFEADTNGFQFIQIRSSAWSSGTATINVYGSDATSFIETVSLLRGATDGTQIGNVTDKLKTDVSGSNPPIGAATSANQSSELTLLGAVTETAPATDTASSGLNGRLQRIAQRLTSLIGLFPTSIGQKANAASLAVTLSTEQEAELGIVTETAPATDTASSGLNGRLQRIAQRITSMIALLPTSLGQKASAASFAVVLSTEQEAQQGSVTETAPATDTASSGHNGRLQRIAQRLTSLIALIPSSVGIAWFSRISDGTDTVAVTTNSELKVVDGLRNGGVYNALNIPTANTAVEAKVGASRLTNRKFLQITIENNGIFWGLDNTVTTTTGIPTVNGQVLTFAIDPDSTFQVWLVGSANNKNVHVVEAP